MKLAALRLFNVRRFADRGIAIENIEDGVNVLCAANEYGKSTCFDALHALFFQLHTKTPNAVQSLRPYSGGSPLIEADIATPDGRFRLTKQFYGGRRATVTDSDSGRLVAQADDAERFIADLVRGGAAGPAGLLWVRQGNTGLEKRSKTDEDVEKQAREGVLSSVQGEVEALTGGRRMVEALAKCNDELSPLTTTTGRPKTGGPYAEAIEKRDRLAEEERRLEAEVHTLREALDARRKARGRLEELSDDEAIAEYRSKADAAEGALQMARSHRDALNLAVAQAETHRTAANQASKDLADYRGVLARAGELTTQRARLASARDAALERQRSARAQSVTAAGAVETAEEAERQARDLLSRLEKSLKAREAAERKAALRDTLAKAETLRKDIEDGVAALSVVVVSDKALEELEAIEAELFGLRAAAVARAPSVTMHYADGADGSILLDDEPMADGKEYPIAATASLRAGELGTITVTPKLRDTVIEELAEAEACRVASLNKIGVATLTEARQRDARARRMQNEIDLARQRLDMIAPDGVEALREEFARAEIDSAADLELKGDPDVARSTLEDAGNRVTASRNTARECRPIAERADEAVVDAEKALAVVDGELERITDALGPELDRVERERVLIEQTTKAKGDLSASQDKADKLRDAAPDLAAAEAMLNRARAVVENLEKERGALREQIADLNGRISARAEDALEEAWQETIEARTEADAVVARLEREVALLHRLRNALDTARVAARDHYFEPVLRELRPLMGLLFDDADVAFDVKTLLPQTVQRDGQVEEVERLSGGMREQLAVLTRLAFARLLAHDGHPTPVILDDALVYSDDDRIEKMFDALYRQGRDQQIIVFSCRQRAFASLGGNMLEMTDWRPSA